MGMIDISELLDDADDFKIHWGEGLAGELFINFEGKLIALDDSLPEGVL
jgi:hypothetical protein